MTAVQKNEIILKVVAVLNEILDIENESNEVIEEVAQSDENQPVELLSIKECVEAINGLSAHTIRRLIKQNKIPCIRTGEGKRGKILVNKTALLDYLNNSVYKFLKI